MQLLHIMQKNFVLLLLLARFLNCDCFVLFGKVKPLICYLFQQISQEDAYQSMQQWESSYASSQIQFPEVNNYVVNDVTSADGIRTLDYLRDPRWFGSSNKVYTACKVGYVLINDKKVYATRRIFNGDKLTIEVPKNDSYLSSNKDSAARLDKIYLERLTSFTNSLLGVNNNPPLSVLYEDSCLAVVFKPAGVHSLQWQGTMKKKFFALDDIVPLILQAPSVKRIESSDEVLGRPLPCHRLDARVPGCLVVAKTKKSLVSVNSQFERRIVKKEYRAVLVGKISDEILSKDGTTIIDKPIAGRPSTTLLQVLEVVKCNVYGYLTRVSLRPISGRRHQLRQHVAMLGHPIVGDTLYHDAAGIFDEDVRIQTINDLSGGDSDDGHDAEPDQKETEGEPIHYDQQNARTCLPKVRQGVGLLLMSVSISFEHPFPSAISCGTSCGCQLDIETVAEKKTRITLTIEESPKFRKIMEKAQKGAAWKANQGLES